MAKKTFKIIVAAVLAIFLLIIGIAAFFFGFNQNSVISWKLMQDFKSEIKDCEELEIIDSKSACGKISGNGNGMEFYGAVLVKAECEEDVEELVSSIDDDYNKVGYYIQADKQIDASPIDGHIFLEYESFPNDGKTYYTVYYFTSHKLSTEFDIRAH